LTAQAKELSAHSRFLKTGGQGRMIREGEPDEAVLDGQYDNERQDDWFDAELQGLQDQWEQEYPEILILQGEDIVGAPFCQIGLEYDHRKDYQAIEDRDDIVECN